MKWVGVFIKGELILGNPYSYENAIEALNYAKECLTETEEFHEVKIYEKH